MDSNFCYTQEMSKDLKTISVYDKFPQQFSEYFSGIGPRVNDIKKALSFLGNKKKIRSVEIGCGDGRDADEIIKYVSWYEGFDPSEGLLNIAKKKVPKANFVLTDALTYDYPNNIDVVFAFASLLHVNKTDLIDVFKKVCQSLNKGGIFYISLKMRDVYTEEIKEDSYGERMFYYYNPEILEEIAKNNFNTVFLEYKKIGHTDWFSIALKKV